MVENSVYLFIIMDLSPSLMHIFFRKGSISFGLPVLCNTVERNNNNNNNNNKKLNQANT